MINKRLNLGWKYNPSTNSVDVWNVKVADIANNELKFYEYDFRTDKSYKNTEKYKTAPESYWKLTGPYNYKDGDYITITNADDVNAIQKKTLNNNQWNEIFVRFIAQFAPKDYVFKQDARNSDISLFYLEETKVKFYTLFINDKQVPFDDVFIKPDTTVEENGGALPITNIKAIINAFNSSEFKKQYENELNYVEKVKKSAALLKKYEIYRTIDDRTYSGDTIKIYDFLRDETIVHNMPLVMTALLPIDDFVNLPKTAELMVIKSRKENEIEYTFASMRQILRQQLPPFKKMVTDKIETTTDFNYLNKLSVKIAGKVYYLHNFNSDFADFEMRFSWDTWNNYRVKITKAPSDFWDFENNDELQIYLYETYNKIFKDVKDAKKTFVGDYIVKFTLIYLYKYHLNDSISDNENVIKYIFNNLKQRWTLREHKESL